MKTLVWNELDEMGRSAALARPVQRTNTALQAKVRAIVEEVRDGGWDDVFAEIFVFAFDDE